MTDQPDDTLLEDDVEEHDFNFDNDKEDALLAETEFDNCIDESPKRKKTLPSQNIVSLNSTTTPQLEQPDQEEDVLDIGIAEEDIVDSENITVLNVSKNVSIEEKQNVVSGSSLVQSVEVYLKSTEESNTTLDENGDDGESDSRSAVVHQAAAHAEPSIENEGNLSENCEIKSSENLKIKSKVISLKKWDGKSYDDVPDLDIEVSFERVDDENENCVMNKVIELVQPAVFSQQRKYGRVSQNFTKRIRNYDYLKTKKRDEFVEDDRDCRFQSNLFDNFRDTSRLSDANPSSYQCANIYDRPEEIRDQPRQVTGNHTFQNLVSEFNDISSHQSCPPQEGVLNRPILATVQITKERYQIAGDFRFMRPPSQNPILYRNPVNILRASSSQSNVRPFDARPHMFLPNAALPSSSLNLMPNSFNERSSESNFPPNVSRQPFQSNNFYYRRPPPPVLATHRASIPSPPSSHPRSSPSPLVRGILPSTSIRQRFPPPLQHSFPPPFPPASFPPSQHHYQQRPRPFSPAQTFFPQPFTRPLLQSQASHSYISPPSSLNQTVSNSQVQLSSNPAQMQTYAPFSQPSFAPIRQSSVPSFSHPFSANPTNTYPGPRSVVFQQAERVVRKPKLQNDRNSSIGYGNNNNNNNHSDENSIRDQGESNCANDGTHEIQMSQPTGYYVKQSIISTSSASYSPMSLSYNSTSVTQPLPPGVFTHQPSSSAAYANEEYLVHNRAENDQIQYSRYTRQEYYSNTPNDGYLHSSNADCGLFNDSVSDHPQLNSHHSKRLAPSPMDIISDGSSVKQMRYSCSNDKSDEDDLAAYREKIEHQKKMREKFVQMKEEQRLKNQMQNFIQNNIKGILQKREQFLRKHEMESSKKNCVNNDAQRKRNQENLADANILIKNTTDASPLTRHIENKMPNNIRTSSIDQPCIPTMKRHSSVVSNLMLEKLSEQSRSDDGINGDENMKQLHKLVKIKYKDGTVALKSFPVTNAKPKQSSAIETSNVVDIDNLNMTTCNENISRPNSSLRRMVISKHTSSSNSKHGETCSKDEKMLVESVRKGITQSSLPLAQRFSNLKPINSQLMGDDDEDDDDNEKYPSPLRLKSKTRLVISDDDETRGVWIRNIDSTTKITVIRRMASTCGTIVRMDWISGHGQLNQAKILFSNSEEARKFVINFHKKVVDSSIIAVNLISENK